MLPVKLLLLVLLGVSSSYGVHYHDYIIIGAGPAGLQMGYFLEQSGRDYVILERGKVAGNFFTVYPRHDQLISINKRHTGKTNVEFNLRHDWNSLLSNDAPPRPTAPDRRHPRRVSAKASAAQSNGTEQSPLTRFGVYSRQMFPHRTSLLRYLNDFAVNASLRIRYDTVVGNITRLPSKTASANDEPASTTKQYRFVMNDHRGEVYQCRTLLIATGMSKPNVPAMEGDEFIENYESVSVDPEDFEGQSVLILGRGNSAFELARSIYGSTNLVHMVGRSRVRLSWATHYVGDLRAVNNELLDTYQLKSLDGLFEAPVELMAIRRRDGKLYLEVRDDVNVSYSHKTPTTSASADNETEASSHGGFVYHDNFAVREPYDRVIRCLGFQFDDSIFDRELTLSRPEGRKSKYPKIDHGYESVDNPGLYFLGTATHSLDMRKSAGGFIHGFRYTTRALHRLLEWKNHAHVWPTRSGSVVDLLTLIVKRINEASGIYQMYRMLGDVILLRGKSFEYVEEFPLNLLHELPQRTGLDITRGLESLLPAVDGVLVVSLEYGKNFYGPNHDVFHENRATGVPSDAHRSNFLHPVIYYYKKLPTANAMNQRQSPWDILPRPDRIHHTVEDFLTTWDAPNSHILPMRRFIESCVNGGSGRDLRSFFTDTCMVAALTHQSVPLSCSEQYLAERGGLERPSMLYSSMSASSSNSTVIIRAAASVDGLLGNAMNLAGHVIGKDAVIGGKVI